MLAEGQTDWVYVDANTGRPLGIPPEVAGLFTLIEEGEEPTGL
jgi:acyl-CoA thioesterase FadM